METRSNHVLVGGVVLAILAVALAFIVWMSQVGNGHQRQYDIFFPNSVDGLAKGSAVNFSGVPVGKIDDIKLLPDTPELVRVRISVDENTPVLKGTTATVAGVGFTGVSQINLGGATKGQPPITDIGPFGVPVIPTKPGALAGLLNSAPELLKKLQALTDRVTQLLDDRNQNSIHHILANLDTLSTDLASQGPQLKQTLANAQVAIKQAGDAAQQFGKLAGTTNDLLDQQGRPLMTNLNKAVKSAQQSADSLNAMINDARPGVQTLSKDTAPQIDQLVRDLSEMAEALTMTANKLNSGGAGGVLGGGRLPDYKPRH
ncbi:MlaD family protein [Sphingomonas oligoaromativorans]|jgi:phospholipid/cholesterol/gamma-HCH transport system substrate-binding protein|uniref:MlaD family protein n=1 Tax=Sphingomonas oligoaromativorans TaxID=575322 RepID=UPI00141E447B|nr:MlaD family protein [Sphingomonas oligoaromativorans]NIJ34641.1 phospholipid/cholesterol/gamma-HCH transport system substrate-binding protein [Sphingomonas oligoaromativorans]